MLINERACTKCKDIKPFSEFHKSARGKYGLNCVCKSCCSAISKQTYIEDPQRIKNYSNFPGYTHEYYLEHKDKIRAAHNKYYQKNKEKILQRSKDRYQQSKKNNDESL